VGEVNMQQFSLDKCTGCKLFIFDKIANSYVDECEDCLIFIGPAESSVFVRNCKNCTVVSVSGQFRVRDCLNCKFYLHVNSQPVIESSDNLLFGCVSNTSFEEMKSLASDIKIHLAKNYWS
jgi:protein XRP2